MKTKLLGVALAAVLLGAALPAVSAGPATAQQVTRIMIAGDSITQGRNGDYTWRYRFDTELRRQGLDVDLVGPYSSPTSYLGHYSHYLATGWDTDHDALSGTTLAHQLQDVRTQVATYRPDILITYLGTNDLLQVAYQHPRLTQEELMPYYEAQVASTLADWKTYLREVRRADPTVKVVLGEVVSPKIPQSIRDEYNTALVKRAALQWFALGSPVAVAQLAGSVWSSTRYLYDGLHPTPTAETFLAQQFATAVNQVSRRFFPEPIDIQRAEVPWDPPLTTKVRVVGKRVLLDWAFAAKYNSATRMRVSFSADRNGKRILIPFRGARRWTSQVLRPGTYRVRLQAQRAAMTSTWGQVYVVKVPRRG